MTYRWIFFVCCAVAPALPAAAAAQTAPYGIDRRPRPQGTDLDSLLPARVGGFAREALPPGAKARSDEDLNVSYAAGADSVFMGFSLPETARDAHEAIKTTREEAISSKIDMKGGTFRTGKDPSWFKTAKFISWSRGPYFYYADANTPGALDRFMQAFPY